MIRHRTNKINLCFMVFIIITTKCFLTDAGITAILKEQGLNTMMPSVPMNQVAETSTDIPAMARIFYSAIGDIVETVPIFPITFNVPDMFTAFNGLLSSMYNYMTGNNNNGESKPKDVLGVMFKMYRTMAVQEDLHDFEFMT